MDRLVDQRRLFDLFPESADSNASRPPEKVITNVSAIMSRSAKPGSKPLSFQHAALLIGAFFGALVISDLMVGIALRRWGSGRQDRTIFMLYKQENPLDVLFLGSSHTYSGVSPQILESKGLRTYDLAMPDAGPRSYRIMLTAFLEANPSPALVAVESSYSVFSGFSDRAIDELILNMDRETRVRELASSSQPFRAILALSDLYCTRRFLKPAIMRLSGRAKEAPPWDRGFLPTDRAMDPADPRFFQHLDFNADNILVSRKIQQFREVLDALRARGIRFVLYDPPLYEDVTSASIQPRREDFESLLEDLALEYDCPILRYNTKETAKLRSDAALFRNGDHLNAAGAGEFTSRLADDLLTLDVLLEVPRPGA